MRLRLIRRDELGYEGAQTVNALGVAVVHQEHRARPVFRPRELDQLAQTRECAGIEVQPSRI